MDIFANLLIGLQTAGSLTNLLYCFVGVFLGTAIGVLPGLGPTATIAILLPITFTMGPENALIMLAGIYYGAQYGGSTTAILVNLPGEPSSVVTAIDGYQMARKGRAGVALSTAAISSFTAGTIATLLIALFAPILGEVALKFGPAEYFSLLSLGLVAALVLAHGSLLQAFGTVIVGLLLGLIGPDVNSGVQRFTFGITGMQDGISFVVVAMGVFGLGEIVANLGDESGRSVSGTISRMLPSREDFRRMAAPVMRGTALGSLLGILPGGGAMLASFASYSVEKKLSKFPDEFGKGAIEGVAGPEAANNAGAQTAFIPMLTLGVPSNSIMALIIGAMIIQGIQPGPSVMIEQPALFWGVIVSMWIGNLMLLVLNLPMIGLWVRMIGIPYHFLFPAILVFCAIGAFSLSNSTFDVFLLAAFGVVGYVLRKLDCEPAPLLLGFILGPMMEENLRRALMINRGDATVLLTRPISCALLVAAVALLVMVLLPSIRDKRDVAFQEE